jgi:hypothetical protein
MTAYGPLHALNILNTGQHWFAHDQTPRLAFSTTREPAHGELLQDVGAGKDDGLAVCVLLGLPKVVERGAFLSREEVERILRQEVERRKTGYEGARLEFDRIYNNIPSGLPSPDGTERIKNAGRDYRFNMREYDAALHEFNSFLCWGIIPDRLREPERK